MCILTHFLPKDSGVGSIITPILEINSSLEDLSSSRSHISPGRVGCRSSGSGAAPPSRKYSLGARGKERREKRYKILYLDSLYSRSIVVVAWRTGFYHYFRKGCQPRMMALGRTIMHCLFPGASVRSAVKESEHELPPLAKRSLTRQCWLQTVSNTWAGWPSL